MRPTPSSSSTISMCGRTKARPGRRAPQRHPLRPLGRWSGDRWSARQRQWRRLSSQERRASAVHSRASSLRVEAAACVARRRSLQRARPWPSFTRWRALASAARHRRGELRLATPISRAVSPALPVLVQMLRRRIGVRRRIEVRSAAPTCGLAASSPRGFEAETTSRRHTFTSSVCRQHREEARTGEHAGWQRSCCSRRWPQSGRSVRLLARCLAPPVCRGHRSWLWISPLFGVCRGARPRSCGGRGPAHVGYGCCSCTPAETARTA